MQKKRRENYITRRYTQEELEQIIIDYNDGNGLIPKELGEKYNRDPSSIIHKLQDIGIYKNSHYRFTKEDIEFLQKHYPNDAWNVIMDHFPKCTKNSIITKAYKLGIKRNVNEWTENEIQTLKDNYKKMTVAQIQELLPHRSISAIRCKMEKLRLLQRPLWNIEEDKLLSQLYPILPIDKVIKHFPNRTRDAIILHAIKLDLKSYDYNPWTKEEDNYIRSNWETVPDKLIADNLGRTFRVTKCRRETLGLFRRDMEKTKYDSISRFIRGKIQYWKIASMKKCNYQCVLTGSKKFHIHHLYSFNQIISDVFNKYNFPIYDTFEEYSDEELDTILDKFIEEQDSHPLGVCIDENIHKLFHSVYGQYCNTPEQWYQFEKDYKNGIYDEYNEKIAV